jgi:hypothetical protein
MVMSSIFDKILDCIRSNKVLVSNHGYDEMMQDNILVRDIMEGVANATTVEEYPEYHKGPCVLVLQKDHSGESIHVVWGIPKHGPSYAIVVTAYRPDPERWEADFLRRKS